jgi:hypothetical protein
MIKLLIRWFGRSAGIGGGLLAKRSQQALPADREGNKRYVLRNAETRARLPVTSGWRARASWKL